MSKEISLRWLSGLEGQRKEEFKLILRNNPQIFNRLAQILREEEEAITKKDTTEEDFKDPEWAVRQAYRLGRKSALRFLLSLLP